MNFNEILDSHIIDEWKEYYISYDMLHTALTLNNHALRLDINDHNHRRQDKIGGGPGRSVLSINLYDDNDDLKQMSDEDDDDDDDDDDVDDEESMDNISIKKLTLQKFKTLLAIEQQSDNIFKSMIRFECKKINSFYLSIEQQLIRDYKLLIESADIFRTEALVKSISDSVNNLSSYKLDGHAVLAVDIGNDDDDDDELRAIHSRLRRSQYLEPLNISKSSKYKKKTSENRQIFLESLKKNAIMLYQRFVVLSNFSKINYMGFEILISKFNEVNDTESRMMEMVNNFEFAKSDKCRQCMDGLITLYSNIFEKGNIDHGRVKLFNSISWHNIRNKLLNNDGSIFWFGTKFGAMLILLFWAGMSLTILLNNEDDHEAKTGLPSDAVYVYRFCGLITLFLWFWSTAVWIMSRKRVNFVFIFELNPRNAMTYLEWFDLAATLSIIYLLNFILFIATYHWFGAYYSMIWPPTMFIFYILRLLLPIFDHWSSRKMLLNSLGQCLIAPFGRVAFRDFFLADVLSSFSYQFVDFYMAGCTLMFNEYYSPFKSVHDSCYNSSFSEWIKIILICIPYWIRFMQKLNGYYHAHGSHKKEKAFGALKYGLGLSVKLMGSFDKGGVWLIFTVIGTMYFIYWDIWMDWKLFPWKTRTKLYPKYFYFVGLFFEILIRCFWVFTLFPGNEDWEYFEWPLDINGFIIFANVGEIFRRAVWSIFRVEKAHIGKEDDFRTYEYVPIFYENNTLIDEKQEKSSKPLSMKCEVLAMFLLLAVVSILIIVTLRFDISVDELIDVDDGH